MKPNDSLSWLSKDSDVSPGLPKWLSFSLKLLVGNQSTSSGRENASQNARFLRVMPQNSWKTLAKRHSRYHWIKTRRHPNKARLNGTEDKSMAVLGHIDDHRLLPSEEEVADHRSEHDRDTKPSVVCHEDQHQHQRQRDLHEMQEALIEMHHTEDCWPKSAKETNFKTDEKSSCRKNNLACGG